MRAGVTIGRWSSRGGSRRSHQRQKNTRPNSSSAAPNGVTENILNCSIVSAPVGRLRLAEVIRSFNNICGELPTMVSEPPSTMQHAIGSSRREIGTPVREEMRLTTGRNSAVRAGFCMIAESRPVSPHNTSSRRRSSPRESLSRNEAARDSTPVRSSPAPRIMVAMIAITALPAKPAKS